MMQRSLREGETHHKEKPMRTGGQSARYFLKIEIANYCFQDSFLKHEIALINETPGLL